MASTTRVSAHDMVNIVRETVNYPGSPDTDGPFQTQVVRGVDKFGNELEVTFFMAPGSESKRGKRPCKTGLEEDRA